MTNLAAGDTSVGSTPTYIAADGDRYEGEWRDGKRHGYGTATTHSGWRFEGGWRDGNRHGYGTVTLSSGRTCEWRDRIIRETCNPPLE